MADDGSCWTLPHMPHAVRLSPQASSRHEPAYHLRRRWFVAVTAGELAGFAVPSLVGATAWTLDVPPAAFYALLLAAGAGEGAVLGTAQWLVLREPLPDLDSRPWITATAAAAAFAWSLGMLPSTLGERLENVPLSVLVPAMSVGGVALLLSIGTAQALVLRRHVERVWLWVVANVAAWCAGLVVSVSLMSVLVTEDTTLAGSVSIGALAGVLMGATVALVTGLFLIRILEPR